MLFILLIVFLIVLWQSAGNRPGCFEFPFPPVPEICLTAFQGACNAEKEYRSGCGGYRSLPLTPAPFQPRAARTLGNRAPLQIALCQGGLRPCFPLLSEGLCCEWQGCN